MFDLAKMDDWDDRLADLVERSTQAVEKAGNASKSADLARQSYEALTQDLSHGQCPYSRRTR